MKKTANTFRTWLIWQLRRLSYRWPPRQVALRKASVSKEEYQKRPGEKVSKFVRNFYRCAICRKVFSRKGVSVDHIVPVIDPRRGWQNWTEYIRRLFCDVDGFQIICSKDHDAKTARERKVRLKYKRMKKEAA